MSVEDYDTLLEKQGGGCAICEAKVEPVKQFKFLAVDHDEESGDVRGILCSNCNQGIGLLKHCPNIIAAAAAYCQNFINMKQTQLALTNQERNQ